MEFLVGTIEIDDLEAFLERIGAVGDAHDVTVQAFDARYVAGPRHLERAVTLADRAFDRGENVARDRAVEICCYAAGRRQIDRALEMGVEVGEQRAVVLVDGADSQGEDAAANALTERYGLEQVAPAHLRTAADPATISTYFDITSAEREATDADLEALVCERVALLEVEK